MGEKFVRKSYAEDDLAGKDLDEIQFETCSFLAPSLLKTRMNDVTFEGCKLIGVDFRKCGGFLQMKFFDCVMDGCNFSDLALKNQTFAGCDMRRCVFVRTELVAADFSHSDLTESLFHECDLTRADFSRAKNYAIDLNKNTVAKTKFSLPEAVSLLRGFDIVLK